MNEFGAVLQVRGLRKEHGEGQGLVRAVDDVDLDVPAAQMLAVMGPSGCGKSTLLHLLGGLERPSGGEVWLAGRRIDTLGERGLARLRRRSVGFVFQAFHLVEELSAAENVELPALLAGRSPRAARRRAADLLERFGLADRARHLPSQLSGGQRQRVAIARAMANEPLVLLADEPTGNLDTAATLDVLRLFAELRSTGQTLVIVTHDERVAATADRLLSMRDGTFVDDTLLANTNSMGREPVGTDPAGTDLPGTRPANTEGVDADPVDAGPPGGGPASDGPVGRGPVGGEWLGDGLPGRERVGGLGGLIGLED
ncbi:ABC transporter ATP-binding protein [Spirillospora sp. NPDC047418]